MRALLLAVLLPAPAFAGVDPPEPYRLDETIMAGPFATLDAYCDHRVWFRKTQPGPDHDPDAEVTCDMNPFEPQDDPRQSSTGAFRQVRFVQIDASSWHVVMQTERGWFGREFAHELAPDTVVPDAVSIKDIVKDREDDLYFEHETYRDRCGCGDLWWRNRYAMVCVVEDGYVRCTDPIHKHADDHGVDISSWDATWQIQRSGLVKVKLSNVTGDAKRDRRALARPFRLRFR